MFGGEEKETRRPRNNVNQICLHACAVAASQLVMFHYFYGNTFSKALAFDWPTHILTWCSTSGPFQTFTTLASVKEGRSRITTFKIRSPELRKYRHILRGREDSPWKLIAVLRLQPSSLSALGGCDIWKVSRKVSVLINKRTNDEA